MNAIVSGKYWHHLPPMPAIIGLDAAGVVVKAPTGRSDIGEGDRVYINPFLNCGQCYYCRSGAPMLCADAALRYFGFTPRGAKLLEDYPYGGLAEYLTAAPGHVVKLPQEVTFEQGARFGIWERRLRRCDVVLPGREAGLPFMVSRAHSASAQFCGARYGVSRILGCGPQSRVLTRLRTLFPKRVSTLALATSLSGIGFERTEGAGVDLLIDCTGRGGPASSGGGGQLPQAWGRDGQYRRPRRTACTQPDAIHDRRAAISRIKLVHQRRCCIDG